MALRWFPAVGAVIGLVIVTVDLAARTWFAPPVADALVVAALVVVTGALHLDGLIDAADGLSATGDSADRLAAMHQPAAGNAGSLAGILALLATFVAVGSLPQAVRLPALLIAPICSRTAIVLAYVAFPYARNASGISLSLKQGATRVALLVAVSTAALFVGAVGGPGGIALLGSALAAAYIGGRIAMRQLPGLTGDLYGALGETCQISVLLLAPALL